MLFGDGGKYLRVYLSHTYIDTNTNTFLSRCNDDYDDYMTTDDDNDNDNDVVTLTQSLTPSIQIYICTNLQKLN